VTPESRTAIAYIAGSIISGRRTSVAFDYSRSKSVNFSGSIQLGCVQVYDHELWLLHQRVRFAQFAQSL
jgi:hypothetical protein